MTDLVNVRGWPGLAGWKAPNLAPGYADRLGKRNALYLFAAAELGALPEAFAVGAAVFAAGPSIVSGAILVPDDLKERSPAGFAAIVKWVDTNLLQTRRRPMRWQLLTLSRFFDPFATVGCGYLAFVPNAYARCLVVGADLGRFFGLVADHCGPGREKRRDAWEVWLPGWGVEREDGWRRVSPHRPSLRLKARRVGWQVEFGPCEKGHGKYVGGRLWRGAFCDALSLAYALDGDRGASYSEHRGKLGLEHIELPLQVPLEEMGVAKVAAAALGIHEFALVLDKKASEWFTTPRERGAGDARLDLARTSSPGAIAGEVPSRFRIRAPLEKFDLIHTDEHVAWAETDHGGSCWGDERFFGVPFPAEAIDATSAFPLIAHLNGWWPLFTAQRLDREDATDETVALCERAARDPAVVLDPAVWHQLGHTIVECHPDGPLPIDLEDNRRPDGRLEVTHVSSPLRPMFYAAQNVVGAAVISGRTDTRIVRSTKLVPVGRQRGLREHLPLLPGLVLNVNRDPVLDLVRQRQVLKLTDPVLAAVLRVVVNALCYGVFGRFDETRWGTGKSSRIGEKPGPWTFLPIASSVTAGSHLLLATFERLVRDRGGTAVYCDTDCWIILASPKGGWFSLPDGTKLKILSWAEVDEIVALFEPLRVFGANIPVWKVERGTPDRPLHSTVFSPKKHAEFTIGRDGTPQLVDWTEANLGGTYADPSAMAGMSEDGKGRAWSYAAVHREVAFALARQRDAAKARRSIVPWDVGSSSPSPAIRGLAVVSPEVLKSLPSALGVHPGTPFLEAATDDLFEFHNGGAPVALDPGGDLANYQSLQWFDRKTGEPIRSGTNPALIDAVVLATLDRKARDWSRPPACEPIRRVDVNPLFVQHSGRVSGVIDADMTGLPGNLRDRRPLYLDDDGHAPGQREALVLLARRLSYAEFARRGRTTPRVAKVIATGVLPRPSVVRRILRSLRDAERQGRTCALEGCSHPIHRANRRFCECCPSHKARANKRSQRAKAAL